METGEPYPGARVNLVQRTPKFAQRILIVGCGRGELGLVLKKRGVAEIHGVEWDPRLATQARQHLDSVLETLISAGDVRFPAGYFDCVVLAHAWPRLERLPEILASIVPLLSSDGWTLLGVPNRRYWKGTIAGSDPEDMGQRLANSGLVCYAHFATFEPEYQHTKPDAEGCLHLGGQAYPATSPAEREALLATDYLFVAVRPSYNPVSHARELFDAGRPDWSYEVLSLIPAQYLEDPGVSAVVSMDMMLCILAMDCAAKDGERLNRFGLSHVLFYQVVAHDPHCHGAYQCQAEFWRRIGDDDMAARLLRSILHVAPDEATRALLEKPGGLKREVRSAECEVGVPPWNGGPGAYRILFITHPRLHYGLDVLYDGLCSVLGDENVVDFPWKPWLHGEIPELLGKYPCTCSRAGEALTIEQIIQPTATLRVSYQNAASPKNYGVEFEFRRRLDAIARRLERFSVNANLTLVKSDVTIKEGVGVQTSSNRALQGQSPFVASVMLGYDDPEKGTSVNL